MKAAAAIQQPLMLSGDVLNLIAWRIPDLVAYQHAFDEWWLAPLDDDFPLVRLNQVGLEMLTSMNGHITVGALLEKYGDKMCGPDGQPGAWHLERWSIPNYSLCYFGTEDRKSVV